MLMIAGVLFIIAAGCYGLDKLVDDARLNFTTIMRICLILSAGLVVWSLLR